MKHIRSLFLLSATLLLASCVTERQPVKISSTPATTSRQTPATESSVQSSAPAATTQEQSEPEPEETSEPSNLTLVDVYAKFGIGNEQVNLPTFVWVWPDGGEGTWYHAIHVVETWEETNNRHYTFTMENPIGMNIVMAVFSASSGFDAEHLPTSWDDKITQSADGVIQTHEGAVFADLN